MMKQSNYEIMRNQMRSRFLQYDQAAMIKKFGLNADEAYIYMDFFNRPYRVDRSTGVVEWSEDGFCSLHEADYNESMSIYDVLCCSKPDCRLAGEFMPSSSLKGTGYTSAALGSAMFKKYYERFDGHTEALAEACRKLGGVPEGKGDVAFRLPVFSFLPLRFEFWESDEDFPAETRLLWDGNVLSYMHYETLWFAAGHLFGRMMEMLECEA